MTGWWTEPVDDLRMPATCWVCIDEQPATAMQARNAKERTRYRFAFSRVAPCIVACVGQGVQDP